MVPSKLMAREDEVVLEAEMAVEGDFCQGFRGAVAAVHGDRGDLFIGRFLDDIPLSVGVKLNGEK